MTLLQGERLLSVGEVDRKRERGAHGFTFLTHSHGSEITQKDNIYQFNGVCVCLGGGGETIEIKLLP